MERQIKFRGVEKLHATPCEWIYGSLIVTQDGGTFIRKDNGETYPVDPDTIGQFTGLYDKNGKEVYEGDFLRYTRHNVSGEGIHNETWVHECEVYWEEKKHAFWHRMKLSCGSCSGLLIFKDNRAEKEEIEVIGNIHEK